MAELGPFRKRHRLGLGGDVVHSAPEDQPWTAASTGGMQCRTSKSCLQTRCSKQRDDVEDPSSCRSNSEARLSPTDIRPGRERGKCRLTSTIPPRRGTTPIYRLHCRWHIPKANAGLSSVFPHTSHPAHQTGTNAHVVHTAVTVALPRSALAPPRPPGIPAPGAPPASPPWPGKARAAAEDLCHRLTRRCLRFPHRNTDLPAKHPG